jgi:hypothetical protein
VSKEFDGGLAKVVSVLWDRLRLGELFCELGETFLDRLCIAQGSWYFGIQQDIEVLGPGFGGGIGKGLEEEAVADVEADLGGNCL